MLFAVASENDEGLADYNFNRNGLKKLWLTCVSLKKITGVCAVRWGDCNLLLCVSVLSILFSGCLPAVWQICGVSFTAWPLLQD